MKMEILTAPEFNLGLAALGKAKVSAKVTYQIAKRISRIKKEQKLCEELRVEKVKELAPKNEDGSLKVDEKGSFAVKPENMKAYSEYLKELMDMDVIGIEPVKLADLGEAHGLLPEDFVNVGELIEE